MRLHEALAKHLHHRPINADEVDTLQGLRLTKPNILGEWEREMMMKKMMIIIRLVSTRMCYDDDDDYYYVF